MTDPAVARILESFRATGKLPSVAEKLETIHDLDEVAEFRRELSRAGALDADAMRAIRDRQDVLHRAQESRKWK